LAYSAELFETAFSLVDCLDPLLGLGVSALERVLEGREPRIELDDACETCASVNEVAERTSNIPVPSLGTSPAVWPAIELSEAWLMGSMIVSSARDNELGKILSKQGVYTRKERKGRGSSHSQGFEAAKGDARSLTIPSSQLTTSPAPLQDYDAIPHKLAPFGPTFGCACSTFDFSCPTRTGWGSQSITTSVWRFNNLVCLSDLSPSC
jgi:hypothetical protein